MRENEVAIVGAARTPIGKFGGQFKDVPATRLGAIAIAEAVRRAGLAPSDVQEALMGNVLQAGLGQNPARQAALAAGLGTEAPATTINQVCGSGLKALLIAEQSIRAGDRETLVAGGMENMSLAPYLLPGARSGYGMGDRTAVDSLIKDGLWCAQNDYHMGVTAENICREYGLSRDELDRYALGSQQKAAAAASEGRFADEIVPVDVPQKKGGGVQVDRDESIRPDTNVEALSKLRPAFAENGFVTAGNASGINDGAAALVLMRRDRAAALGLKPLAVVRSGATVGVDPALMGIGPIPAAERALEKAGLTMAEIDLIEANEAFASQALVFQKHFGLGDDRLNVNGGAIALGHPIGASGARVVVTLLYEMIRRRSQFGLAALCIGGGQGIAVILERCTSD